MFKATLLGCGSSGGIPRIGPFWGDCDPHNPKNRRTRCSLLIEQTREDGQESVFFLIDTSPDLREQCLRENVKTIDAVAYTHDHADQSHGIDELRVVYQNRGHVAIPTWMFCETAQTLLHRFDYCFKEVSQGYPPFLLPHVFQNPFGQFLVGDIIQVETFEQRHGLVCAIGYKIKYKGKSLVYSPDVHLIPEKSYPFIEKADVWIVDCLGYNPHPTHAHLSRVLEWVNLFKPEQTILTNLHTTMDYTTLTQKLPEKISAGYDGIFVIWD